ncbi:hypothetical protein JOB18_002145, partial [Solea senegalensis]
KYLLPSFLYDVHSMKDRLLCDRRDLESTFLQKCVAVFYAALVLNHSVERITILMRILR